VLADLDSLLTALYVLVDDLLPSAAVQEDAQRSPTPSSSRSLSLRSSCNAIPSGAFCAWPTGALDTCSPTSPSSPATTSACGRWRRRSAWPSASWRGSRHPSVIGSGCLTPHRCPAAPRVRRSSALSLPAGRPMGTAPSHSRYFWGLRLYLLCASDGMPISFCLAPANEGEREVAWRDARSGTR